jgi:hypothetical protein
MYPTIGLFSSSYGSHAVILKECQQRVILLQRKNYVFLLLGGFHMKQLQSYAIYIYIYIYIYTVYRPYNTVFVYVYVYICHVESHADNKGFLPYLVANDDISLYLVLTFLCSTDRRQKVSLIFHCRIIHSR